MKRFLLGLDILGHPLSISYKGNKKHPTFLGATLSTALRVFVLIQLYTQLTSLILMSDPNISSYARPMLKSEINGFGLVNLADYSMKIGIIYQTRGAMVHIPEELGRFVTETFEI